MERIQNYLIFDFDGVLANTRESIIQTHIYLGDADTRENAIKKALGYANFPVDHSRNHTMTDQQMKDRLEYLKKWGIIQNRIGFEMFDDFIQEIKKVKNSKIAIVSSNSSQVLHHKIDKLGLDITHLLGFEDHHSKEEKIEKICIDWGVEVSQVYYFTDTKADIYELEQLISPGKLIGCSRGFSGYNLLCELLPNSCIMNNYTDIHHLF